MKNSKSWEERVQKYEEEGCTRSDAQAIVDAEDITGKKSTCLTNNGDK